MPSPPDEDMYNVAEPYPGFRAQVVQLLLEADALVNDMERHQIWSTDSLRSGRQTRWIAVLLAFMWCVFLRHPEQLLRL